MPTWGYFYHYERDRMETVEDLKTDKMCTINGVVFSSEGNVVEVKKGKLTVRKPISPKENIYSINAIKRLRNRN